MRSVAVPISRSYESEINIEPTIGQHTREVLVEWLQISGKKVDTLLGAGVIGENDENKK